MASTKCAHSNLRIRALNGQPFTDSNIIMMQVQFVCAGCRRTFTCVGVRDGMSYDAPSTMDGGETMAFPLVPLGEEPQTEVVGRC